MINAVGNTGSIYEEEEDLLDICLSHAQTIWKIKCLLTWKNMPKGENASIFMLHQFEQLSFDKNQNGIKQFINYKSDAGI